MDLVAPIARDVNELHAAFQRREPFRHLVVDGFLDPAFARSLLEEFPPFSRGDTRNEAGAAGGKSVVEKIRALGPSYAALDDLVQSRPFLDWLSGVTGIPDLLYDPWYFGGGTHDNRHGQELDPHVDFNRHPETHSHRRLNLIVYLNPEWRDEWGGVLELHSDPRAADDRITRIVPEFNRAVLFETTEWSWHAFDRIALPEARRDLTRRSIALYFYSKDRPEEERALTHSTIYIDRPLPARLEPGHTLTTDDVAEFNVLIARRDQHNQRLYAQISVLRDTVEEIRRSPWLSRLAHVARLLDGTESVLRAALRRRGLPRGREVKTAFIPLVRELPAGLREPLRRSWRRLAAMFAARSAIAPAAQSTPVSPDDGGEAAYAARVARENEIFAGQVDVHALPQIFHYWSNRYLLPMEQEFGARHPEDFLAAQLFESARRNGADRPRLVSLGAGNCDTEIRIAQELVRRGLHDFEFECLDLNPAMIERGIALAREAGLEGRVLPRVCDLNRWRAPLPYDGVMASQSLHHMLELETVFDAVHAALKPDALFVISDMIGRNGHQRWPEALAVVREFWRELPESYRYNLQLQRQENEFLDWDCSVEGFEGVRSQDILPLLSERFGFELFLAFGNAIDPFIDRSFGHHFDPAREWDRDFIDRVHARDEAELQAGRITPTHVLASMSRRREVTCRYRGKLSPEACIRRA